MEKRKMSYNIGRLKFDEAKNQFKGFVNGQYTTMKEHKGEWFLEMYVDVAFFEPKSNEKPQEMVGNIPVAPRNEVDIPF